MNERIYDLAEQAEIYANELIDKDGKQPNQYPRYFAEKFAELIVREYGNIVLHYTDVDEGVKVANKHFGVEE